MRIIGVLLAILAVSSAKNCPVKKSNSKLFCHYSKIIDLDNCYCTHAVLPANSDVKSIDRAREQMKGVKILVTVNEFNQGLIDLLKTSKVDGLEINLKKLDSKNDISDFISTVRSKLGSDLYLALSVPAKAEILAKYFDFKSLSKHADLFILQTAFLGASQNVTFHPSRLSGLWDMQNTDSVVDLVSGLGAPLSKLVITAPVQAFHFKLQNQEFTAPGSPALEIKSLTRNELCNIMSGGANWTLERDQDQAGPYIFSEDQWIAFDDSTSMDIKAKYSRVRGLAGLALKDVSQDGDDKCGPSILEAAYNGLSRQARAPRGAVLHSLEREILETARPLDRVQVSPYRISRIIDVEGKVHAIRQDTRTEFQCSRQGYFVHPRSCNRFYRCVKFDQLVDDFNVFEFDCPAGLAFDERVEVCVWPGSLPHGTPCSGSSEIAPVPKERFICPAEQGYYADPENCRWFFACLDHGKSPLSAYEFRCPFGLVFDSDRLMCEWPWLVPRCGSGLGINLASQFAYGGYGGYSSGHGNGVLLQQYDALGALGAVKLGGVTGTITQPIVYSNVGTAGLGYQNGGYVNQNGYIVGTELGGLSAKAAQSLQTAGLLRPNLVSAQAYGSGGIGLNGNRIQYGIGTTGLGSNLNAGGASNINLQYNTGVNQGLSYAGEGNAGDTTNVNLQYNTGVGQELSHVGGGGAALNLQYNGGLGARGYGSSYAGEGGTVGVTNINLAGLKSSDAGHQVNLIADIPASGVGAQGYLQYQGGNGLSDLNNAVSQEGLNVLHGTNVEAGNVFGAKTAQTSLNNLGQGLNIYQYQGSIGTNLDNLHDIGNKASHILTQYQGQLLNQAGAKSQQYEVDLNANLQNNGLTDLGAKSFQTVSQYHDQNQQIITDNSGHNQQGGNEINIAYNAADVNAFGSKLAPQNIIQYQGQGGHIAVAESEGQGIQSTLDYDAVNANAFGAKSTQSFTQYQGEGVSGNINIVGGGYSAVGASKSGIEIANNGVNIDAIVHSTPSPISIATVSSVPAVTSVPLPKLKTATGFESFNGGVIANVPQLQYKVYDNTALSNTSSNFVRFISTTPSSLLINQGLTEGRPLPRGEGSYSYQSLHTSVDNRGYDYPRPNVAFEEGPVKDVNQAVVSGYSYTGSSTVRPALTLVEQNSIIPTSDIQKNEGYVYSKPSIAFEESPLKTVSSFSISTPTTIKPFLVEQKVQPIIPVQPIASVQPIVPVQPVVQQPVVSYAFHRQESRGQQGVIFGERQQPQIIVSSTPQPVIVEQQPQVFISSTVAPIADHKITQPAVSSYSFTQQVGSEGYNYPRPTVAFEEKPLIQPVAISRFNIRQPVVQPTVASYKEVQPVVTSYNIQQPFVVQNVQPTAASYSYQQTYRSEGYQYPRPAVPLSQPAVTYQKPVTTYNYQDVALKAVGIQPTVIPYNYVTPSTPRPSILVQNQPVVSTYSVPSTTARPSIVVQKQPAVVSSYSYTASKPVEFKGYDYPRPSVTFEETPLPAVSYENKQPVEEVPFLKQKAYVTGQAYHYKQPIIVENYQAPELTQGNTYSQSVDTSSAYYVNNVNTVSSTPSYYSTPIYQPVKQVYVQTTPRPTYKSTVASVVATKAVPVTEARNFYYYDSRLSSTPKTLLEGYSYPQPDVRFEETPVQPIVTTTYLPPTKEYLPAQTITTSGPIFKYSFNSLGDQHQYISTPRPFVVQSTTPLTREYIPVKSKVQVTTPEVFVAPEVSTIVPVRSNLRYSTTSRPLELVTPSTAYLPVRSRVRVTTSPPLIIPSTQYIPQRPRVTVTSTAPLEVTTLSRDYLPVRSRVTTTSSPIGDLSSRRPAKITIIKQNDFHPILAAKLGAQCTCISNNLQPGKRKKIIIVEDDEDDDGYIVGNNNQGGVVLENYRYNPQETVDITPTPQIYVQSTTNEIVPAPTPTYIRKRVRVRPVTSTVAYQSVAQSDVSEGEIVSAVRTGLKLVKQAAKEGAKEGTEEVVGRYGNINVRGAIECERAGLFRHPSQCNKFYACRWDCNKNKFTVHTFNCPIHLTFDNSLGACNWPSQGPACLENTLLPSE